MYPSYFEDVHYRSRNGLYDEAELNAHSNVWVRILVYKGLVGVRCQVRDIQMQVNHGTKAVRSADCE